MFSLSQLCMNVSDTVELRSWILGWGEKVKVLQPKELRETMRKTAKRMVGVYRKKQSP